MTALPALKVLIVEDQNTKLTEVTSVVAECAGDDAQINSFRDAHGALRFLEENAVDLAVIDLMLPLLGGADPVRDGGLQLLESILQQDDVYKLPAHIVGLTAYDDAFQAARGPFDLESWSLIEYDETNSEWRDRLARKIRQIRISKSAYAAEISNHRSFACILTALDAPELDAVLDLPWSWRRDEPNDDVSVYYIGEVKSNDEARTVIAASAIRVGIAAAASLATKMIHRFRPRYIGMVGITAGMKGECNEGDIIVADPTWHWEAGKHSVVNNEPVFSPQPNHVSLNRKLLNRFDELRRDQGYFAAVRERFEGNKPDTELALKIGPMASGSAVLSNESLLNVIRAQHRKALAFEMESYGVYVAAQESDYPQAQAFCMKGVSDFADGAKSDKYQHYAAYTSARTLQRLIEHYL